MVLKNNYNNTVVPSSSDGNVKSNSTKILTNIMVSLSIPVPNKEYKPLQDDKLATWSATNVLQGIFLLPCIQRT